MTANPIRHRQVDALAAQIPVSTEDRVLQKVLKQHSEESYHLLRCLPDFRGLYFAYPASGCPSPDEERDRKSASKISGTLGGTWKLHYGQDVHFFIVASRQLACPVMLGSKLTFVERAVHIHTESCKISTCSVMKDTPWIPGTKEFAYRIAEKFMNEWRTMCKSLTKAGKPVKQPPPSVKSLTQAGKYFPVLTIISISLLYR